MKIPLFIKKTFGIKEGGKEVLSDSKLEEFVNMSVGEFEKIMTKSKEGHREELFISILVLRDASKVIGLIKGVKKAEDEIKINPNIIIYEIAAFMHAYICRGFITDKLENNFSAFEVQLNDSKYVTWSFIESLSRLKDFKDLFFKRIKDYSSEFDNHGSTGAIDMNIGYILESLLEGKPTNKKLLKRPFLDVSFTAFAIKNSIKIFMGSNLEIFEGLVNVTPKMMAELSEKSSV